MKKKTYLYKELPWFSKAKALCEYTNHVNEDGSLDGIEKEEISAALYGNLDYVFELDGSLARDEEGNLVEGRAVWMK